MKILAIIGSPRKKNSTKIINIIEEEIKKRENVFFEYIYLKEIYLGYCIGCGKCMTNEEGCPLIKEKDDFFKIIKEKLLNSDIIIFSSPVYSNNVTALMKNFLDRFHYLVFRPMLTEKKAIVLSTAAHTGLKTVLDYLDFTARSWGCHLIGKMGILMTEFNDDNSYKEKITTEINSIVNKIIKVKNNILNRKPDFIDLLIFKDSKERIINNYKKFGDKMEILYKFWEQRGWLTNDYFFDYKINPITKFLLKFKRLDLSRND